MRCLRSVKERNASRDPDRQTTEIHICILRRLFRTRGIRLPSHQPLQRTPSRRDRPRRLRPSWPSNGIAGTGCSNCRRHVVGRAMANRSEPASRPLPETGEDPANMPFGTSRKSPKGTFDDVIDTVDRICLAVFLIDFQCTHPRRSSSPFLPPQAAMPAPRATERG